MKNSRPLANSASRTLLRAALHRLWHNKVAIIAFAIVLLIVLGMPLGLLFAPHDYTHTNLAAEATHLPPSFSNGHFFGTDDLGRDLFARVMLGGCISIGVGLVCALVSLLIGVAYGATAGYVGGRVDTIMMRVVEILYALPFMFFVILLMVFFGRNIFLLFVAIGFVSWLDIARIVRGQTLSLKQKDFIEAVKLSGASTPRIIFKHIVPNLFGVVIVYATLTIPHVILVESFLSFLGLGVQEPWTSWGTLINEGRSQTIMRDEVWRLIIPSAFLAILVLALNVLGDALRDALDPKDS